MTLTMAASLAVVPLLAQADDDDGGIEADPFRLDRLSDGMLLGTGIGLMGAVVYLDKIGEVNRIDFDGSVRDIARVNRLDRPLMNPYSEKLDRIGTGFGIASILLPAVMMAAPSDRWLTIGTMYAETMILAYGIKEAGKLCLNRARPYTYFDGFPLDAVEDGDWCDSFPSGHTTLAFAGASFTSYVFCELFPDSPMKIPIIASSYALALGTAVCRIAGGNHFLTDVVAGTALGTTCGLFIPWTHTRNRESPKGNAGKSTKMSFRILPSGIQLSFVLDHGKRNAL